MLTRNRSNVMLTELVIVVLFFSLISVILTQMFVATTQKSQRNLSTQHAMILAEDQAEQLGGQRDPAAWLLGQGYSPAESGLYRQDLPDQRWLLEVAIHPAQTLAGGEMLSGEVRIYQTRGGLPGEAPLVALPLARYWPDEEVRP